MFNWTKNLYRKVTGKPTLEQEADFRAKSGYNGKIGKADTNYNLTVNLELQSRIYEKEKKYSEAKQFRQYLNKLPGDSLNKLENNLELDKDLERVLKKKIELKFNQESRELKERRYDIQLGGVKRLYQNASIHNKKKYIEKIEKDIENLRERKNQINSFEDLKFRTVLFQYAREEQYGKDVEIIKKRYNQLFEKIKERIQEPSPNQIQKLAEEIINKTNKAKEKRDSVIRHVKTSYCDLPENEQVRVSVSLIKGKNERENQPPTELQKKIDAYSEACKKREGKSKDRVKLNNLEEKLKREGRLKEIISYSRAA